MNHACRECGESFSSFEHLQQHKKTMHEARKSKSGKWIALVVLAVIVVAIIFFSTRGINTSNPQYDVLAKCIADSGAKFYGAFWCAHCRTQKEMFGSSAKYLPYIECSSSDGKSQLQVCADAGITGYPTWVFPDGSRASGEVSMQVIASRTGCSIQ